MPWISNRWPPERGYPLDADTVINAVREALAERDALVPVLYVPAAFSRWDPLLGTPKGRAPEPLPTIANFQYEIQKMLTQSWPLRWWDPNREELYTLAHLCQDAFGRDGWTHDLTAEDAEGGPANPWTPACAVLFDELYRAINRLDRVRIPPTTAESRRRDSVERLTTGIADWAAERAATFALFDGADDGAASSLAYDVGMGGEVLDDDSNQWWSLEAREFGLTFATGALAGYTVRRAWLDFTTAAPEGAADYGDTFTAEVIDDEGTPLGTFDSDDYGPQHIEVPAGSVRTEGDTALVIRSTRADAADRPAWAPPGPNYTSTYREGLAVAAPIRLIVEVDFEYRA